MSETVLRVAGGSREFSSREDAIEFAKTQVAEGWVVHWYPRGDVFRVDWWVQ